LSVARRKTRGDAVALASANPPLDIPVGSRADIAVLFPGLRPRHDGWTQARTQRFLDTLAYTGCVKDAARVAGMSAVGARRMRRRFPRFDAAWNDALERGQQGLIAIAYQRAVSGRETIIIRKGEEYERRITPSDAMLALMVKRGDLLGAGALSAELRDLAGLTREEIISWPEWRDGHVRFNRWGQKYTAPDPAETQRRLEERCNKLMNGLRAMATREEACPCCQQKLPPEWPTQSLMAMTLLGVVDIKDHTDGIPMEQD
jgi:hypothetical protein